MDLGKLGCWAITGSLDPNRNLQNIRRKVLTLDFDSPGVLSFRQLSDRDRNHRLGTALKD
ncbi:hypothetical protein AMR42_03770 [Limnothrix sp. PR1529]|nr:hypothetical protein BCR12_16805 [Limnothrix sp. P13C2]PIB14821.1 hypothetical protein AMR42_03770 [Limnothrix sp. PR1529]